MATPALFHSVLDDLWAQMELHQAGGMTLQGSTMVEGQKMHFSMRLDMAFNKDDLPQSKPWDETIYEAPPAADPPA